MSCRVCRHQIGSVTHDLCRSHSDCSRGFQYFAAPCAFCRDLWDRASNNDDPIQAIAAFKLLETWVHGFRKNSRNRPPGTDFFADPQERVAYEDILIVQANIRRIPGLDLDPEPSGSVSIRIAPT